ncbi:MAG: HPr family phosphocarrier protein [Chiayiivirga sp.]|jgi:phosphocarrier protein|nr:HPr family phosphocarrier protein [Xanthomonadaceae bacterium]MDX9764606.1 HPr family phosphocarrier protein [Chiayiivirga sp.]MEB2314957.1 HPr family phosphocarrier protein [Xanthomonadaceae bacterium]HMN34690.1 HPr family phosphocarrier protein [Chiayiivirga sp.]HRQ35540.1 HPr family phosphocarrier protein [Chiayiivirga sp.]
MREQELVIVNALGLHARAAARVVRLLSGFSSQATLEFRNRSVNAKSILGVMLLAAAQGARVVLRLDGPDEDEAMAAAAALFERGFDEQETA